MSKKLIIIIFYTLANICIAQEKYNTIKGIKIEAYSNHTNLPMIVELQDNVSVGNFTEWFTGKFTSDRDISFVLIKSENDQYGNSHNRFQEFYKGYKIENSMLITHGDNNLVKSFSGDWFNNIKLSNTISLNEQDALQFALNKVNANKYKWDNLTEENHMKAVLKNPSFTYKPKGDLVILPEINKVSKQVDYVYAYKFNIYAEKPLYRANLYIDATSGKVIKEHKLICTIDAIGTANTKYSGTQQITTDSYNGSYRLRETGRGGGIETYNLNNGIDYSFATDFTNITNTWNNTGFDQAATDAHFGTEKTYDYFLQTFNRNSIDDAGHPLLSYVHYDINFTNAFWDGQRMTYGDGDPSIGFDAMTALDICGHEITHGLVQYTAMLNGGESDALNEAFSDIFGTTVEWYARPNQRDWLMGVDAGSTIRNMSNPKQLQQPDTYYGQYWDPNDQQHQNAGPAIYWYYLLCAGGNGINDNGQTYNISSITMAKAAAIAYRALAYYMTPSTDYMNVRAFTIQAAKDLYGSCSNEVTQTTNAWYAVGVGNAHVQGAIAPNFTSSYPTSCSAPYSVNFNNNSTGEASVKWYFGDGNTSTSNNPSHTYLTTGVYSVKLVAIGCVAGTKDSIIKTNYVSVSPNNPCIFFASNPVSTYSLCSGKLFDDGGINENYTANTNNQVRIIAPVGNSIHVTFNSFDMEDSYDYLNIYQGLGTTGVLLYTYTGFNLPNNGNPIIINTNSITIVQETDQFLNGAGFELDWKCVTNNATGVNAHSKEKVDIFPNPAVNNVVFSNLINEQLLEVYDAFGRKIYSEDINNKREHTISIQHLSSGVYLFKLYSQEGVISKKIIKQ